MLNDYKGEKPNNVITEEEHKKRPFYKKVSFWVLSVLGLFFGGCSVYGLVLGYQYVHAVTEAAHIIADANDSDSSEMARKKPLSAYSAGSSVAYLDLGSLSWTKTDGTSPENIYFYSQVIDSIIPTDGAVTGSIVCADFPSVPHNNNYRRPSGAPIGIAVANQRISIADLGFDQLSISEFKEAVTGVGCYYRTNSDYTGKSASEFFTEQGYQSGYDEGHQDGYQEGYDDGSDAINLPQSVKVLLPVGNEYSVQYKSYVDGVVDRQGQLNSSQTGGAYATFDRSRTQKLRIDLTLPTGSRAFFLYTPSWTASYPTDENYPLRQSWAVSGFTYLPTWVGKPQIYVGVTSADVPDLTYETISVAFDVDHWGDIKVGAYSQGYTDGFQAGQDDPTAYDSGYDAGYSQGYDDGHTLGVAQGESQAVSGQKALVNMFVTAFQQPFDQIYRFLNFNVLGLNILALFTALLTLSIGIIIIKKVI